MRKQKSPVYFPPKPMSHFIPVNDGSKIIPSQEREREKKNEQTMQMDKRWMTRSEWSGYIPAEEYAEWPSTRSGSTKIIIKGGTANTQTQAWKVCIANRLSALYLVCTAAELALISLHRD